MSTMKPVNDDTSVQLELKQDQISDNIRRMNENMQKCKLPSQKGFKFGENINWNNDQV